MILQLMSLFIFKVSKESKQEAKPWAEWSNQVSAILSPSQCLLLEICHKTHDQGDKTIQGHEHQKLKRSVYQAPLSSLIHASPQY